jgi:hypothetical protein
VGGTGTCDAVVITTDRTVYAPRDGIHVTITNQINAESGRPVTVLLLPQAGRCPGVQAERLQGSGWEAMPVCSNAPTGRGAATGGDGRIPFPIAPGTTYDTYLAAGNQFLDEAHRPLFPVGIYHLVAQYVLSVDAGTYGITRVDGGDGFTLYSQPFRVCTTVTCS